MHQPTGNIRRLTDKQAKTQLNNEWSEVKFVENEKGERVMRFTFDTSEGVTATVDVQENGTREVSINGQPVAE